MSLLDEEAENALDWLEFWRGDLAQQSLALEDNAEVGRRSHTVRRIEFSEDEALRALWAKIEAGR